MWRSTEDGWMQSSYSGSISMRPAASSSRMLRSERIIGRSRYSDRRDGDRHPAIGDPLLTPGSRRAYNYNQMVVDVLTDERADRVFHALADATRRDIVLHALQGEHSVSAIARRYPMSFAAVQKHVAVLEGAGLVTKQRHGREQLVSGNVETMRKANRLLEQLEAVWKGRIDRIGDLLADERNGGKHP